jgi:DNA-binding NarL/FixJ family response regulator
MNETKTAPCKPFSEAGGSRDALSTDSDMKQDTHADIAVSIVEDDLRARHIFCKWIREAEGFRYVSDYRTAEDALIHLPQDKPDVVLTDINLPVMSGIEVVRRLKATLPKTQFLMLTVYEDADHIFEALAAGAIGYLLKETPLEELLSALRSVYAGGSPMSGSIARKVVQTFQPTTNPQKPDSLSPRERQVLEFLVRGYLYKEIADTLSISVPTVNAHIRHVYEKLHVRSRGQAVAKYRHLS